MNNSMEMGYPSEENTLTEKNDMNTSVETLTQKEKTIIQCIANGCMTTAQIATELQTTPKNVERLKTALYTKLNVRNNLELMRWACKEGWVK